MSFIQLPRRSSCRRTAIAVFVSLIAFCLPTFANALEIHHIFAEVDHDGHEHSDFDLCQWVKANSSGSTDFDHVGIDVPFQVDQERWFPSKTVYSSVALTSQGSRGPPLFF